MSGLPDFTHALVKIVLDFIYSDQEPVFPDVAQRAAPELSLAGKQLTALFTKLDTDDSRAVDHKDASKPASTDLSTAECKLVPVENDEANEDAEFWQVEKTFKAALNNRIKH